MSLLVADEASTILSDICEFVIDSEHRTAPTQDSGYPYIRTPNIGRGRIITENLRYVSEEAYIQWTRRGVPKSGDLILAREAPVGNIAIVKGKMKPCLGQRTVLIRPNTKLVDPDFLTYFLLGDEVQSKFHGFSIGATVPHLNMSDIRGLKLPQLPRLHEQRIIGSILSAYDDLIENNHRRIQLLEEMARAIYREWFVHFRFPGHEDVEMVDSELGEIPEAWEIRPFSDIADFLNGYAFKPRHWQKEGKLIVKIAEMKNGIGSSSSFYHGDDIPERYHIDTGNLLFAWSASLCTTFWTGEPALLNQHIFDITPRDGFSKDFMYHSLSDSMERFKRLTQGATMTHIRRSALDEVCIAVPPPDIRNQFDYIVGRLDQLLIKLEIQNRALGKTRDLLLPKLVSGQIDVSDLWIEIPTDNHQTSKYSDQSTLDQWPDGDEEDGGWK